MTLPDPFTQPTLLVPEAAELLGVSRSTAYQAIRDDRWPTEVIYVGSTIRIPTADVLRLLKPPPPSDMEDWRVTMGGTLIRDNSEVPS